MTGSYSSVYQRSLDSPEEFWAEAAQALTWRSKWDRVIDDSRKPFYRWYAGGKINVCENAIDRHVEAGHGDQPAIIHDSPMTDSKRTITYAEAQREIARIAGGLSSKGVGYGDRVIIYMPMVPEAVFAMLACARLGAVHSVVFGGFGSKELASRVDDSRAKFVLSASCGLEPGKVIDYKKLLDDALEMASHKVAGCAILQREAQPCELTPGRDVSWDEFVANADPADCVDVDANDPLYILYTSGTTGKPKGIVHDGGGLAVAMEWTMNNLYDVKPGEVYWAASDIGWIVGHSYIVYAPLIHRCTTVMFEGKPVGTPDAGTFWRVISEHNVAAMFTAPTAIRAIKKEDPKGEMVKDYDMSCLRGQFLAGERCDPDTITWLEDNLKVPVIDHWWQTETGWAISSNPLGIESFPVKAGSSTKPVPGYDLQVLNDDGEQVKARELGNLTVKLPMPPGTFTTIWGDEERMRENYLSEFDGHYLTGDSGMIDEDGYVHVMSRIDDVINVAAHRLSTGQMEEILCAHPDVAEAAVFGVADDLKGELPLGLAVLNSNVTRSPDEVASELVKRVREELGAVAAFKLIAIVMRLPKTRSGKILRATMRKVANGQEYEMPATIDDPAIIDEITIALSGLGYPLGKDG